MAVDAEDLLIRPFRDVVALGSAAAANAGDAASPMSRAARALVREGDRALNKVQLVWKDQVAKHGDTFKEAILQQASVEQGRFRLEELLWDFEDFIHADDFDPARYSALQVAARALAVDIIDTTKRLELQPTVPAASHPSFPPLPPLPSQKDSGFRPPFSHSGRPRACSKPRETHGKIELLPRQRPANLGEKGKSPEPTVTNQSDTVPGLPEGSPEPPAGRPLRSQSLAPRLPHQPKHGLPRNAFTPPASPGIMPGVSPSEALPTDPSHALRTRHSDLAQNLSTAKTRTSEGSSIGSSSAALLKTLDSLITFDDAPDLGLSVLPDAQPKPPSPALSRAGKDAEDGLLGFQDFLRETSFASERRRSRPPSPRVPDCAIHEDSTYHKLGRLCRGAKRFRKEGHWGSIRQTEFDHATAAGNMASNGDTAVPFGHGRLMVGACADCAYAHDLDDVQLDKHQSPNAIRTSEAGPRYRLRLLFKSHLRQLHSGAVHYACLWCAKAHATVREGDATVFRSAEDLLRHLGRHPQPLPSISGITVCYGQLHDSTNQEFDLHLPESPAPVPIPENVARLPTAIAVRDHYRRRPGRDRLEKPPGYDADMLEFMDGAIVTGILWPTKWAGKYCLGRHDGEFGAFPARAVELRPPQESEIPLGGENGMSVTTRWRWQPPVTAGSAPWLSFGKGEVLTNVQCLYSDYWCWSGTNSKGKTGVFPLSYIDIETLRRHDDPLASKKGWGNTVFGPRSNSNNELTKGNASRRNSIAAY